MNIQNLQDLFMKQKMNRWNISSSTPGQRIDKLKKLKRNIIATEQDLKKALQSDFSKPFFETESDEVFVVLQEINHAIKNLKKWMRPRGAETSIVFLG